VFPALENESFSMFPNPQRFAYEVSAGVTIRSEFFHFVETAKNVPFLRFAVQTMLVNILFF